MMKSDLECLLCGLKQVLNTMKLLNQPEDLTQKIMLEASEHLFNADLNNSPAKIISPVYEMIYKATGNYDPYKDKKIESNKFALSLYSDVYRMVENYSDPLYAAAKASAIGNVMDMGIGYYKSDIKSLIKKEIHQKFDLDHYQDFIEDLEKKDVIIYLGDNSGEIVFDKIFIIEIAKKYHIPIYYIIKGAPIINDVTIEDADFVGMDEVCNVRENGSKLIGTQLGDINPKLKNILFDKGTLIISKGQGNFETLYNSGLEIYFILKSKCRVIANMFNTKIGDSILFHQKI
jgi:hypothetical protein